MTIRLRFNDFSRATRSRTLPQATGATEPVLRTCRDLLEDVWPEVKQRGLTLLGMSISNLDDAHAVQLSLPFARRSRDDADTAIDSIREKFGRNAISPVALLGRRGIEMPMLPDQVPTRR